MVRLTKIYTRTGDEGHTALGDNSRVSKNDPRLIAYADVDEANSSIGMALTFSDDHQDVTETLRHIQHQLFDLGADLATPLESDSKLQRVPSQWARDLEVQIDKFNEPLNNLDSFVIPGGTRFAAALHVARTVVRRAERSVWAAGNVNPECAIYLNRLSDLLFVFARVANGGNDVKWVPAQKR